MPRRFIHAADLHLDSPFQGVGSLRAGLDELLRDASLVAWDALIELCLAESAEFLVIAGDLFDSTNRTTRFEFRVREGARRLVERGVRVFVVHGNHDPLTARSPLEGIEGVTVFGSDAPEAGTFDPDGRGPVTVHGISFGRAAVEDNLATRFVRGEAAGLHVGVLHCSVGEQVGHSNYAPCLVGDLTAVGLDYWALGHIHAHADVHQTPPIVYAGALQGRSPKPSDRGPHGAVVVEFEGDRVTSWRLSPIDVIRFDAIDVPIDGLATEAAVEERLLAAADAVLADAGDAYVLLRARLTGSGPLHATVAADDFAAGLCEGLREAAAARLIWERIVSATRPEIDLDEVRGSAGFAGDLLRSFDALEANPTLLAQQLEELEQALPDRASARGLAEEEPVERLRRARDLALAALFRHEGAQ